MFVRHYGLLLGFAASLSLALAGCSSARTAPAPASTAASAQSDPDLTDATLWTLLGLAKKPSEQNVGPVTGSTVSPVLWQAAQDTLHFAGTSAEDPMTGMLVTNWYSPPGKPDERLRVSVFVLSRALRSDSLASHDRTPGALGRRRVAEYAGRTGDRRRARKRHPAARPPHPG